MRRRSTSTPASRPASRCTSPGTRPAITRRWPPTPRIRASASARSTPTCSRTMTTGSAAWPTRTRQCEPRRWRTCWSASASWTRLGRGTSNCGSPMAPTTPGKTTSVRARTGWRTRCARYTRGWHLPSGCCWSTSCSSRRSTPPMCRTGAPRCCTAWNSARRPLSSSTPGAGRLGGFDFNSRFYADDDLMVGAADPFQLFRILHEVVLADAIRPEAGIAFMLDQCHNIEPKIPAQIRSVMNVQEATAKALLVDAAALAAAQQAGDVLGANAVLMDACNTDVRPLLAGLRGENGLDPDPIGAYARSGYGEKIVAERVGGTPAGWGS